MTPEHKARQLLARLGVDDVERFSAGDLGELATVIADRDALVEAITLCRLELRVHLRPLPAKAPAWSGAERRRR